MSWIPLTHTAKQCTSGSSTTGNSVAIDTTGARLIIAACASFSHSGVFSDSGGNTWSETTIYGGGSAASLSFLYCIDPITSASHTFILQDGGNTFPAFAVAAFAIAGGTIALDQQNGTGATAASTIQTGSITPGVSNALILAGVADAFTGGVSINSGFTITDQLPLIGSTAFGIGLAYFVQSAQAAINPTWSDVSAQRKEANIVSFVNTEGAIGVLAFGPPTIGGSADFETPTGPGALAFGPLGIGAHSDAVIIPPSASNGLRQFWTF